MKPGRILVLIVVLVIAALLVWRLAPGLRHRAIDAYQQHAGWTEEARQADPVGFIDYAEKELTADLAALKETRTNLADAKVTVASQLESNRSLLDAAEELAEDFREAYRQAEPSQAYPAEVAGARYGRDDLIQQVRLILLQRRNYEEIIEGFEKADHAVDEKRLQLVTQITGTEAALAALPAKREIARVNQLTGSTDELLKQVNELIGENERILAESPVRTVEELVRREPEPAGTGQDVDAMAFLEAES